MRMILHYYALNLNPQIILIVIGVIMYEKIFIDAANLSDCAGYEKTTEELTNAFASKKLIPNTPIRTLKEIADSLLKKEKDKHEAKKHKKDTEKVNTKEKAAKLAAMKARRREFASQKARLILIMIEDGQDYVCSNCKSEDNLTVDHIFPLSRGGTDDPSNLAFLCQSCNSKKGAKIIGVDK